MTSIVLEASRSVPHPPERVWRVVSDHSRYAEVAANLSAVEVVSGAGEDMTRRCTDTRGRSWFEICDRWEKGRRFGMVVDTSTYPLGLRAVFSRFRGDWSVEPECGGAVIGVRFEGRIRGGPLAPLLSTLLRRWGEPLVGSVLDGYERELDDDRR